MELSPLENYNFAITAKELALGRGGDQVVIKNNEKIISLVEILKKLKREQELELELLLMH